MKSVHWLVQYLDPEGMCRAFATGQWQLKEAVRERAKEELKKYRAEKRAVNDLYLAEAVYTLHEEEVVIEKE